MRFLIVNTTKEDVMNLDKILYRLERIERFIDAEVAAGRSQMNKTNPADLVGRIDPQHYSDWDDSHPKKVYGDEQKKPSNFQQVALYNKLIGNEPLSQELDEEGYWKALERQYELMLSEFQELKEALDARDLAAVRKETGDVLVTAYGLTYRAGYDADADMEVINKSNMSKFCQTQDEVDRTQAYYRGLQVEVEVRTKEVDGKTFFAIVSAKDQTGNNGQYYPKGKQLKGIKYREAELD